MYAKKLRILTFKITMCLEYIAGHMYLGLCNKAIISPLDKELTIKPKCCLSQQICK